jgi:hypothetical protein
MNPLIDPPGHVRVRANADRLVPQGSQRIPGGPRPPRSSLDRGTSSATTTPEMEALRRRVWQQQGVVSLHLEDITDPWLRQAIQNEAVRRWGPRHQEKTHGR